MNQLASYAIVARLRAQWRSSLRHYDHFTLRRDLIAGLTVAFVALPQSIAYALIAGVPAQYGIYAFITGSIVAAAFGSSRHLQSGPTNASAIVIASTLAVYAAQENFLGVVFLLGFLAGSLQLAAGLLQLGNLTEFISKAVLTGFIAAAGLLIMTNQLPNLLGFSKQINMMALDGILNVVRHLDQINPAALAIGAGTILGALFIQEYCPKSRLGLPLLPPYLTALLAAAAVVWLFKLEGRGLRLVGEIPSSLPPLSLPVFDWKTMQALSSGALALGLIGLAESYSAAKSVAAFTGDKVDPDQELIGQGAAKIVTAFLSGMPVSGSITRTLLNYRAGALTRFANVFAGIFVALAGLLISPVMRYLPVAALAGILMLIATTMVNWREAKIAWHTTRGDRAALLTTFIGALVFPLDQAIFIGVGISIILFLRKVRKPRLTELVYDWHLGFKELDASQPHPLPEIAIVHISGDVFFGTAEFLENELLRIAHRPELRVLILRMRGAACLDATFVLSLMKVHEYMKAGGKLLLISGATSEAARVLERSGLEASIGRENIFFTDATLFKATRRAIDRAVEFLEQEGGNAAGSSRHPAAAQTTAPQSR